MHFACSQPFDKKSRIKVIDTVPYERYPQAFAIHLLQSLPHPVVSLTSYCSTRDLLLPLLDTWINSGDPDPLIKTIKMPKSTMKKLLPQFSISSILSSTHSNM
jgi:hypothetical protein